MRRAVDTCTDVLKKNKYIQKIYYIYVQKKRGEIFEKTIF